MEQLKDHPDASTTELNIEERTEWDRTVLVGELCQWFGAEEFIHKVPAEDAEMSP